VSRVASVVERVRGPAERLAGRVMALPAVRLVMAVMDSYGSAGGGLLAGGLAYAALFALLPGLLLVVSVLGFVLDDPAEREAIVEVIATALPPLEDLARTTLDQVVAGAVPSSIIGLAGLAWGASRFYTALDAAFARIFHNTPERNLISRSLRGVALIGIFVAGPLVALGATAIASVLIEEAPLGLEVADATRVLLGVASPLVALVAFIAAVALTYRLVPARHIPLGVLGPPAIAVGVVLTVFTQVFTYVAPRLIGAAALYGTFVAIFATLAWLSFGFNFMLIGVAWVRVRLLARIPEAGTDGSEAGETAGSEAGETAGSEAGEPVRER
jgi:membrane protein